VINRTIKKINRNVNFFTRINYVALTHALTHLNLQP